MNQVERQILNLTVYSPLLEIYINIFLYCNVSKSQKNSSMKSITFSEEAAKRRGSCVELLGEQVEGDSPPKQTEGDSPKQTEGDSPKQTEGDSPKQNGDEGKAGMGRRGSAVGEKEEGHKEAKDKLGNIPKLQRQRTRTRTISTSVYQDTEGRCTFNIFHLCVGNHTEY